MDRRKMLGLAGAGVPSAPRPRRRRRHADRRRHPPGARPRDAGAAVPFYGEHQAGIVTPAQDRLHFVAFDVITDKRARAGRAAGEVDDRGRADDGRPRRRHASARSTAPRRPRPTTPVRRSACRRRG